MNKDIRAGKGLALAGWGRKWDRIGRSTETRRVVNNKINYLQNTYRSADVGVVDTKPTRCYTARAFHDSPGKTMKKIISLALLAAACGGAIDQLDEGEDDATAASYALFTVRRDERKCAAPACGGWWATAL